MKIKLNVNDILIFQQISWFLVMFCLPSTSGPRFPLHTQRLQTDHECLLHWMHGWGSWSKAQRVAMSCLWNNLCQSVGKMGDSKRINRSGWKYSTATYCYTLEPYCFFFFKLCYLFPIVSYICVLIFLTAAPTLLHHSMPGRNYYIDLIENWLIYIHNILTVSLLKLLIIDILELTTEIIM